MDFSLDEEERQILEVAARYARERIEPLASEFDRREDVPREILVGLAEHGLFGVALPPRLGGMGATAVAYSLSMMEIASACASTAVTMAVTNMVGEILVRFGTERQQRRWVPELCRGALGAFALSEPEAGSDPAAMRTVARREGKGFVLRGAKQWISHGDEAGLLVVWARTGGAGPSGISAFLVEGNALGVEVSRFEEKMGLRGSHTVGLSLDEVRVGEEALLGDEGSGFAIAMAALDGGRIGIASQALGIAEAAHRRALAHLRDTGASEASRQSVATTRTELDAARLLTLRAASRKSRGQSYTREASIAKAFATEAACRACDEALRLMGPRGWDPETGVERHVRDVRVTMIYEGTSEIQRVVIARETQRPWGA